jgi:DNA-binding transcriptional ArsR family regulator
MASDHGQLLHIGEREARAVRRRGLSDEDAQRVAGRFRALGDPTRLGLAMALRDGRELCVCDLSWIAGRTQALTSHHMKILRAEGVVGARREGKMTMYRLTPTGHGLLEEALAPERR